MARRSLSRWPEGPLREYQKVFLRCLEGAVREDKKFLFEKTRRSSSWKPQDSLTEYQKDFLSSSRIRGCLLLEPGDLLLEGLWLEGPLWKDQKVVFEKFQISSSKRPEDLLRKDQKIFCEKTRKHSSRREEGHLLERYSSKRPEAPLKKKNK